MLKNLLLAIFIFILLVPASSQAAITGYTWYSSSQGTTLHLIADNKPRYKSFILESPLRLVIDLEDTIWPNQIKSNKHQLPQYVKGLRWSNSASGTLRVVLDLEYYPEKWDVSVHKIPNTLLNSIRVTLNFDDTNLKSSNNTKGLEDANPLSVPLSLKSNINAPNDNDIKSITQSEKKLKTGHSIIPISKPHAEVVDVQGMPLTSKGKISSAPITQPINQSSTIESKKTLNIGIPLPVFKPTPPNAISKNIAPYKPIIVIDPGHGGKDPGATGISGNTLEKEITLSYALALKKALERDGTYRVILTRNDDTYIPLNKRVMIAHNAKADLFIALHADSHNDPSVHGLSVYTLSDNASDREAEQLAKAANKEDVIIGLDLSTTDSNVTSVLIDLIQRDTRNNSLRLAELVTKELNSITKLLSNAKRSAGFRVLTAPDIPSILLEMGYLSNRNEEMLLGSSEYQKQFISALKRAIDQYISK